MTTTPAGGSAGSRLASGRLVALGLVLVYAVTFIVADGLNFEASKDERHFLESARFFDVEFPPGVDQLRAYREVITPLAFVVWGQIERATGNALFFGRLLNMLLGAAVLSWVALGRGRFETDRVLAALGLLLYPYFLALNVHLYTDIFAAFFVVIGTRWHLRGHPLAALAAFVLAISTRQYMVAVPVALLLWETTRVLRGETRSWLPAIAAGLASASLLGWFAFFGGLAPQPGMEEWINRYPAPMKSPSQFMMDYALYFLACIGTYFVLPELVLFRRRVRWDALASRRTALTAAVLLVLFLSFPPVFDWMPGGVLDRALRFAFPLGFAYDLPRLIAMYALALCAVVRFGQRLELGTSLVAVHCLLLTQTQLAWDKYAMPAIVVLWLLKAERLLDDGPYRPRAGEAHSEARGAAGAGTE